MSFGEQLQKEQRKQKLTNLELAGKAGMSPVTLTKLLRSERSVIVESLDQAAAALGMQVVIKLVPKPADAAERAGS